jgi:tetratricopeptide (TPR) repeat protein
MKTTFGHDSGRVPLLVWLLAGLLFSGCGRPLEGDLAQVFQEAEKAFAEAKSPEDFLKAAALDQELLDRGMVCGAVLYNQGNAFMQAGQRGRAIAAYRQARRYLPRDPFLEANLQYALANQPAGPRRPLVEHLLFWQDWISYPDKFYLAATAVGLTFCLAVGAIYVSRRWLNRLTLAGLALSLLLIFSAGYDWYRYQGTTHGVIVQKQTVMRKGNAESYAPALTGSLDEGAEFEVLEHRNDWLLIRLVSDQEGWIPELAAVVF